MTRCLREQQPEVRERARLAAAARRRRRGDELRDRAVRVARARERLGEVRAHRDLAPPHTLHITSQSVHLAFCDIASRLFYRRGCGRAAPRRAPWAAAAAAFLFIGERERLLKRHVIRALLQ